MKQVLKFNVFGTPKPLDYTGKWNEESYEAAVEDQIRTVNKSYTGGLVVAALNGTIDIRPERTVQSLDECGYHPASRTLFFTPGLRIKGSPLFLALSHPAYKERVGAEPDNTLIHELWHAQRSTNGFTTYDQGFVPVIDHLPWLNLDHLDDATDSEMTFDPGYLDRFLEFDVRGDISSILVENIYASEKHPNGSYLGGLERRYWYPLRADHHSYRPLRNPGALIRHRVIQREIAKLIEQQPGLLMRLAMAQGDFNPFHDYIDMIGRTASQGTART